MSCLSYYLAFFVVFFHLILLPNSLAKEERNSNQTCPSFECGVLGRIGFPFSKKSHPECGLSLLVDNCNEHIPRIQLGKNGPWLFVSVISQDNTLTLHDNQEFTMPRDSCNSLKNMTLPISPFISVEAYTKTLFKCPSNTAIPGNYYSLHCNETQYSIIFSNDTNNDELSSHPNCSLIEFRANKTQKGVELLNFYAGWFRLRVNVTGECRDCDQREGQCQFDDEGEFQCLDSKTGKKDIGLGLALGITYTGIGMLTILAFCFRKKLLSSNSIIFWKKRTKNHPNIEAFLKNHGSLAPKRYSYLDVKKMTNSFKHKLGRGGFGSVYRGSLLDGRKVAVKVLEEAKSNGEEFINEVASISKTSHVNIVTLLGFCFEGNKRALIYEFVPNGSLEKFIYEKYSSETTQKLTWETLYHIAVGIARGLEYLHRGCSIRILHFDIKPHNILLDEDFCPKISDFGLAKICPGKESIISMTGARGTIGYIAPEVFCRNFGNVSHKSDVYSYGMMVLEMVGATNRKSDVGVYLSSEIYFPHWIYKRLEIDEDLGLQGISNEEDQEYARKMIIVSLWCIQTNPLDRPKMSRVVEMLEGSLGSLQIPAKPYLSSP